jgi:hypothetical protein
MKVGEKKKNQNLEHITKIWRFGFYFFLRNLANLAEFRPPKKEKKTLLETKIIILLSSSD